MDDNADVLHAHTTAILASEAYFMYYYINGAFMCNARGRRGVEGGRNIDILMYKSMYICDND